MGDEPFAVKTGTAILSQGGSAADAVTAMFFAMTATYPVAAGLGGGGICLVADPVKGVQEFDFLPRAARKPAALMRCRARCAASMICKRRSARCPGSAMVSGGEAYAASGLSHQPRLVGASGQCPEQPSGWMQPWRRNS